jgi:hypothetical protein
MVAALLPPVLDVAAGVVHEESNECHKWDDAKKYHI